jgi:hypothetical protein
VASVHSATLNATLFFPRTNHGQNFQAVCFLTPDLVVYFYDRLLASVPPTHRGLVQTTTTTREFDFDPSRNWPRMLVFVQEIFEKTAPAVLESFVPTMNSEDNPLRKYLTLHEVLLL